MAVVVQDSLVTRTALQLFGQLGPTPWFVDLFVNLKAPAHGDLLSQYTVCTLPGYAQVAINGALWVGGLSGPGIAFYTYPQITWNFGGNAGPQQTIYGYIVHDGTHPLYAELFPAPFPVPPAGGQLPLVLTWQDEQCLPA